VSISSKRSRRVKRSPDVCPNADGKVLFGSVPLGRFNDDFTSDGSLRLRPSPE